jgi:hypothetical protein
MQRQQDNINTFLKTLGVFCGPHSTTSEFNLAALSCKHGMNIRIPYKARNLLTNSAALRFPGRTLLREADRLWPVGQPDTMKKALHRPPRHHHRNKTIHVC